MSYADVADFKDAVGVADTYDDTAIQRALDAATSAIDSYCGRVFTAQDTSLSTRIFDTDRNASGGSSRPPYSWFFGMGYSGMQSLKVPDVAAVTAIELDLNLNGSFTTSLPSSSWILYPLNVGQPGVRGNYTEIRLRPNTSYAFWPGYQVRVTGLWGWPTNDAPPEPVKLANILLANRFYRRASAPFGLWEGPQMGQLAILPTLDPDVIQLLAPYQSSSVSPQWVAA